MTVDKTGEWWHGSSPQDIEEYLREFTAQAYPIHEFRLARCTCGSEVFRLEADDGEGVARRTCVRCANSHFMCDSEEYSEDAELEQCVCPCEGDEMNVGVGFALYPDDKEVKWLYVGCRCARCGVLGCYADWKIAYAPSR